MKNDVRHDCISEAKLLKKTGAHVVAVGVGDWLSQYELESIASHPIEKNVIRLRDFQSFTSGFERQLRDLVCKSKSCK